MTNYKIFKPIKEGDSVQYVGVYVLEWKKEWGRPEVGFAEIEELPNSSGGYLDALLDAEIKLLKNTVKALAKMVLHYRIGKSQMPEWVFNNLKKAENKYSEDLTKIK